MFKRRLFWKFLVTAFWLLYCQSVLAQHGYDVCHTSEFSVAELWFQKANGYDIVGLNRAGWLADLGKPMLPCKEINIALPHGMKAERLRVLESRFEEIPGDFRVFPSQPPIRTGIAGEDRGFINPQPATYSSSEPYPPQPARLGHQADLAGQGIAAVQVYPLQYVPAEGRLRLCTSITLCIEGVGGYECGDYLPAHMSDRCARIYEETVKELVQNRHEVDLRTSPQLSSSKLTPNGPFDHVIITSSTFTPYFQPLVDWHTQKGVKDTVVTTDWIYSHYTGADSQKVRSFIVDASSTWGAVYFLLGGEDQTVPLAYRYYYSDTASSDQYYSDYDDDWIHEVFVGRVTVEDTTEVNTFVSKVLKYERDPPRTNYPLDILLIGMDLNLATHMEWLKESIDTLIPPRFNVTKVYDSHAGDHQAATVNALNSGQHLVNHSDHADFDVLGLGYYWHDWGLYQSEVNLLSNYGRASVIVSLGCHPNHMDYDDCIAETFVIHNAERAGVAFTGNTRSGYSYGGNPYSLSGALDKEWWVGLFQRNKYNLGETLVDAKHHFGTSSPDMDAKRHCEWTFNLLGEPEMPIWTAEPDSFDVTCPTTFPRTSLPFPVQVKDATTQSPVSDALVCLWKRDEVYLSGYTDSTGEVNFDPRPFTQGIMYVTVTKHNHIPHEQEVEIPDCAPGDANCDGAIGPADIVYLVNYLFRGGPAPVPLQAGDCNCDGSVAPGDVVYLLNYLYRGGDPPDC